jgi:hypothetical protein
VKICRENACSQSHLGKLVYLLLDPRQKMQGETGCVYSAEIAQTSGGRMKKQLPSRHLSDYFDDLGKLVALASLCENCCILLLWMPLQTQEKVHAREFHLSTSCTYDNPLVPMVLQKNINRAVVIRILQNSQCRRPTVFVFSFTWRSLQTS